MNRNFLWLMVAAVAVGSMLTTMTAEEEPVQTRIQWEYKNVRMPCRSTSISAHLNERVEAELNELGKNGWEVVIWDDFNCLLKRQLAN